MREQLLSIKIFSLDVLLISIMQLKKIGVQRLAH
jgi:hypothetical protein